jgi:transcriptional regulator with XRE-family HTH domain
LASEPTDAEHEALACFRRRVRYLRGLRGLSQTQMATALGISQSGWSKIESGAQEPSLGLTLRVVRVLELDSVEMLFGPAATGRLMANDRDDDSGHTLPGDTRVHQVREQDN